MKSKTLITKENLVLFIVFILIITRAFFLEKISTRALYDFDEARYAEVAKNIIKTKKYFLPLAGGPDEPRNIEVFKLENGSSLYPYFWKPPLHTQTIALFYLLFGVSELSVRLPSLIFSILGLIILYKIGILIFENKWISVFAIIFFSSSQDFSFISSQGLAESQLLFFCLFAIYFWIKKPKPKVFLSALMFSLAYLTKSFAVFWVPLFILAYEFTKTKKSLFKNILLFSFYSFVLILPWHLFMFLKFKEVFVQNYFLANTIKRVSLTTQNVAPLHWYLIYLLDQWKPYVFVFALTPLLFLKKPAKFKKIALLPLWALLIFVPFSLSKSKVFWYIYPVFPPLMLLLSASFSNYQRKNKFFYFSVIGLSVLSLLPFWQLTFHHIPLKTFLLLTAFLFLISPFFLFNKNKTPHPFLSAISLVVFILVSNIFSIKSITKRSDFNQNIKKLALRNQNLTNLAVIGQPYEAALFYFNSGNIGSNLSESKYLITNTDSFFGFQNEWSLVDKEGSNLLLKKLVQPHSE